MQYCWTHSCKDVGRLLAHSTPATRFSPGGQWGKATDVNRQPTDGKTSCEGCEIQDWGPGKGTGLSGSNAAPLISLMKSQTIHSGSKSYGSEAGESEAMLESTSCAKIKQSASSSEPVHEGALLSTGEGWFEIMQTKSCTRSSGSGVTAGAEGSTTVLFGAAQQGARDKNANVQHERSGDEEEVLETGYLLLTACRLAERGK